MASVVALRSVNGGFVAANDEAARVLVEFRRELYKYDPKHLATIAGCSVGTVMAFRSGRTVWPRPHTLFALLEAVGYTIKVFPK